LFSLLFVALGLTVQEPTRLVGTSLLAPPSQYDALSAIQAEVANRASGYYGTTSGDLTLRDGYPIDVHLVRCDKTLSRHIRGDVGQLITENGYDCVIDVYPVAEPHFRTYGFFYHSGYSWRYYGSLGQGLLIEIDRFDNSPTTSRRTAKQGSVLYSGQPFGKRNLRNPYQQILDSYNTGFDFHRGVENDDN